MAKDALILDQLYKELKTKLLLDKKLIQNSVLLSFFEIKSNKQLRLLQDSTMDLSLYLLNDYRNLIDKDYIRETEEESIFYITAKGIWEIEQENVISTTKLISYIDSKYFINSDLNKKTTPKEKIILLSLIIARAFSKENCLDLNMGNYSLDACKVILDGSNDILSEVKIFKKLTPEMLYKKTGNEHIISNLIRHTDSLPKKSNLIYTAPGQQKYYLNISIDGEIDQKKLSYLFEIIFGKDNSLEFTDALGILGKINEITYEQSTHIYTDIMGSFVSPSYDDVIKEALLQGILEFY